MHGDTPSLSLVERMSAARDYMQTHPQTIAIVSGGQGSDENISEAEAMTAWLTDKGIDKSRIIAEDKATSTLENLENSFNIIRQRGDDPNDSCAVVKANITYIAQSLRSRWMLVSAPLRRTRPICRSWLTTLSAKHSA